MARRFGSYILDEVIGRGGMGEVWRGRTVDGDAPPLAIKLLRRDLTEQQDVVARFLRERNILVRLQSPYIVQVHDLVAEGGELGIVMDLVNGSDLRRALRGQGTLPPAEAARLGSEILRAAAEAHAASVVHRDLKPENVLLATGPDGRPEARVTDFGIARLTDGSTSLTKISGILGTPNYMAPEMIERGMVGPPVDVYSSGILLYELLCGVTPFGDRPGLAVLRAHVDLEPGRPPGVPDQFWSILAGLLSKDPGRRPSSAGAADALAGLVAELAPVPAGTRLLTPPPATSVRGQWSPPTAQVNSVPGSLTPPTTFPTWPQPPASVPGRGPGATAGMTAFPGAGQNPGPVPTMRSRTGLSGWLIAAITAGSTFAIIILLVAVAALAGGGGDKGGASGPSTASEANGTAPSESGSAAGPAQEMDITRYLSDERALDPVGEFDVGSSSVSGHLLPRSLLLHVCEAGIICGDSPQTASVEYDLGRDFRRFQTTAGLSDDATADSVYLLEVYGDGRKLASQQVGLGDVFDVDVDVTGILRLQLLVTHLSGDDAKGTDRASVIVFGDARITGKQSDVPSQQPTS